MMQTNQNKVARSSETIPAATIIAVLKNYRNILARIREIENVNEAITRHKETLQGAASITIPKNVIVHDAFAPKGPVCISESTIQLMLGNNASSVAELERLQAIAEIIRAMINSLDGTPREVIESLYIQGNTYDRTEEILGISRNTVTLNRRYAIAAMCRML